MYRDLRGQRARRVRYEDHPPPGVYERRYGPERTGTAHERGDLIRPPAPEVPQNNRSGYRYREGSTPRPRPSDPFGRQEFGMRDSPGYRSFHSSHERSAPFFLRPRSSRQSMDFHGRPPMRRLYEPTDCASLFTDIDSESDYDVEEERFDDFAYRPPPRSPFMRPPHHPPFMRHPSFGAVRPAPAFMERPPPPPPFLRRGPPYFMRHGPSVMEPSPRFSEPFCRQPSCGPFMGPVFDPAFGPPPRRYPFM